MRERLALGDREIDDVSLLHAPLWNTAATAWKAKREAWSWSWFVFVFVRVRVRVRGTRMPCAISDTSS